MTIEHSNIADPYLHEPRGVAFASSGQVYQADGSGSGAWADPQPPFDPNNLVNEILIDGTSLLSEQQPTAVDQTINMTFGPAQGGPTDPVELSDTGVITFNEAGTYRIDLEGQFGRSGGAGVSIILARSLINASPIGTPAAAKLDDGDVLLPFNSVVWLTVPAGTEQSYQLVRDPSGDNSGGLFRTTTTASGWDDIPCCSVLVSRLTGA